MGTDLGVDLGVVHMLLGAIHIYAALTSMTCVVGRKSRVDGIWAEPFYPYRWTMQQPRKLIINLIDARLPRSKRDVRVFVNDDEISTQRTNNRQIL